MTTEDVLRATLHAIRRDGWKHDGWGLTPPWCIRKALTQAVNNAYAYGRERDAAKHAARQAISKALGQPLGLIAYFEGRPGRTQEQVEEVLTKAISIAGVSEKAIAGATG